MRKTVAQELMVDGLLKANAVLEVRMEPLKQAVDPELLASLQNFKKECLLNAGDEIERLLKLAEVENQDPKKVYCQFLNMLHDMVLLIRQEIDLCAEYKDDTRPEKVQWLEECFRKDGLIME